MVVCDFEKYLEMKDKVLFSKFLSYRDRIILLILIHYCSNGTNICRISISDLMEYSDISNRKTMISIINHLEKNKYIKGMRDGNKTKKYEILDVEEAEEYAIKCEEERELLNSSSEKLNRSIEEDSNKDSSDGAEPIEEVSGIDNLEKEELVSLTEEKMSCSNNEYNNNKSDITICSDKIKKMKIVADNHEGGEIDMILYSSNKISITVFKVDRFKVEIVSLE